MRLELDITNIRNARFGDKTAINKSTLIINREELRGLLKEDARLADVEIELALPGEKCRITRVFDVIEPRAKAENGSVDFPGG